MLLTTHHPASQLTVRDADDGTAIIEGRAVPYNETIELGGVRETFAPNSVNTDELTGVPVLWQHDRTEIIGTVTAARQAPDGAMFTATLIPTSRGRDAIIALRAGAARGLSIGFEAVDDEWDGNDVTRRKVRVREVSVATLPAYETAAVLAVREETPTMTEVTEAPPVAAVTEPDDRLARRVEEMEARMLALTEPPAPPAPALNVRERFTQLITDYGRDRAKISVRADMVSSGNSGLTSTERTSREIIEYFDETRYFVSQVASIPFPSEGIVHTLPRKTQRSQVGQAAEKAAAPSRAITTDTVQFTGVWYKGYLDISYELIRTSTPGAVSVAVDDMLGEAAVESELEFVGAVEAAAADGTPLVFTDYKGFVTSVRANVKAVRAAAGKGTPKFALTSDSWDELLTFVDATDRRLLSTVGPSNADGTGSLIAEQITLAGILFFESPHSAVDVAFNDNSLRRSELPPINLSADNVPNIGRDVGVLGNIMAIPRIPAGVVKAAAAAPRGGGGK